VGFKLYELPHHASGAGSNPAPVITFFSSMFNAFQKNLSYVCEYIESRCEKGNEISKYIIKQGS